MFEVDTDENIIRVSLLILSTLLYFQISALVFLCVKGQILKILVQVYEAFNLLVPHKTPRTLRLKGTYHLCTFPYLERNKSEAVFMVLTCGTSFLDSCAKMRHICYFL